MGFPAYVLCSAAMLVLLNQQSLGHSSGEYMAGCGKGVCGYLSKEKSLLNFIIF